MLYKQVIGFDFYKPVEGKIGKLRGMILNTNSWRVTHFVISYGMGKKAKKLVPEKFIKKFDIDNNQIILTEEHQEEEVPKVSRTEKFMCKDFIGIPVLSSDGKKIGKIFDFDIPERLKIWKIWKIMIRTGIKKRRLRISPSDIKTLDQEMVLRKSYDELFPEEE